MTKLSLKLSAVAALTALAAAGAGAQTVASQDVPLKEVVLFSSGVGFFQRVARITGNAGVELSFRAEQVNDILKSLVLMDPEGSVRPVTYTAQQPHLRRLPAVGQGLNGTISIGSLLRQFQGAQVRVEAAAETNQGRILSVNSRQIPVKEGPAISQEVLNILTTDGLRAIPLDQVTQVRLLDERLDRELRESLALLATGLDDQRKKVELRFSGNGVREVRAGYLQEMPVWKTSYRLVLEDVANAKPYLQGWAIVENTTDEDWKDVKLSLVSGRPVSFIQDLYQPLYVPRPTVAPQVLGSPTPQAYNERLDDARTKQLADKEAELGARFANRRAGATAATPPPAALPALAGKAFGAGGMGGGIAADMMGRSVSPDTQTAERGDLFEYAIKQPVNLSRGQAAMVPIVSEAVDGEAVSIFDPAADGTHALSGFRLKNITGLHLAGGPITVFRQGGYAGDAQIGHLQPGEDRLLSFAVDLDLVVGHEQPNFRQETLTVTAKSGVLVVTRKQIREHVYTFRNKSGQAKSVLIQQPIEPEFKLTVPAQASERTPDSYRFKLPVPAKQNAELKVVTERPISEGIELMNADLNLIIAYSQSGQASEKLRGALKQLITLRRKLTDIQATRARMEGEIKTIDQEQNRIRQNMAQLDRTNPLYQQYVKKLTDQEARIEKLRTDIAKSQDDEAAANREIKVFIDGIALD